MAEPKAHDRGAEMYEKILGKPAPPVAPEAPLIGVRELGRSHLFAEVWSRPGLSIRDRRLVTLALLASQGRTDQLRDHLRGARLGEGTLSEDEIQELMVHVAHYAGWAAGASGQSIAGSVFAEIRSGS
jgi:alkylhydroperoxidase/carboxymuconolactone decarboxylase family protein YurZ